jgi:hypothetical protein
MPHHLPVAVFLAIAAACCALMGLLALADPQGCGGSRFVKFSGGGVVLLAGAVIALFV